MFRQLKDELTGVYWSFIYTSIKCCFSEHKDVICKLTRRPFTWNNLNDQPTRYRRSWKLPGWCWPITEVQQLSVKGKGRCTSPATRRRCLQIMSYYTCPDTPAQVFLSITPLLSLQVNSKHSQTKEQREILLIYTPDWEEYSLLFYSTFTCCYQMLLSEVIYNKYICHEKETTTRHHAGNRWLSWGRLNLLMFGN